LQTRMLRQPPPESEPYETSNHVSSCRYPPGLLEFFSHKRFTRAPETRIEFFTDFPL
jgi:hypothetical protein